MLRREEITRERADELAAEAATHGHVPFLSHAEREANRRSWVSRLRSGAEFWVFGYGSLMWNPAFHFHESQSAYLVGYHRRFCLWMHIGRGSPERPGLMLALDRGGSCHGIAFRLASDQVESETEILWLREMISGAYAPRVVRLRTARGPRDALTFVANRHHPRYSGKLSVETTVSHLKHAEGALGSCREYLANTVAHLHDVNVGDRHLDLLYRKVTAS